LALPCYQVFVVAQVPHASKLSGGFVVLPYAESLRKNRYRTNSNGNNIHLNQQSIRIQSSKQSRIILTGTSDDQGSKKDNKKPLIFQSSIPKEVRKKIYEAEGNTQAAKDRTVRMIGYILFALIGSLLGIGNGVLTEVLSSESSTDTATMVESSFGWLQDNPFLTTKWGGIIALISAGVFGTLAELEWRTRDENAERIWEEMKRRQQQQAEANEKQKRKMKRAMTTSKGGSKTDTRPSKRMSELAQVLQSEDEEEGKKADVNPINNQDIAVEQQLQQEDGIFGKLKKFYKQADDMAAAQALLLNKKLEDTGVIEKITDESGLKVIGKDAASKLKSPSREEDEKRN